VEVIESVRVGDLFVKRRWERRKAGSCGVAADVQREPRPGSVTLDPRELHS
jgi:hypothetical protein